MWHDIGEGLNLIRHTPLLRSIAWGVAAWNFLRHMFLAVIILYATQELATVRQHGIAAKLVLVDDSAYGILKVYQSGTYEATHAVDLVQPDFEALARAYGVPVFSCDLDGFAGALDRALDVDGPAVTLVRGALRVAETTP